MVTPPMINGPAKRPAAVEGGWCGAVRWAGGCGRMRLGCACRQWTCLAQLSEQHIALPCSFPRPETLMLPSSQPALRPPDAHMKLRVARRGRRREGDTGSLAERMSTETRASMQKARAASNSCSDARPNLWLHRPNRLTRRPSICQCCRPLRRRTGSASWRRTFRWMPG